ncbi:MAG: hypothetical protein H7Z41_08615 [Cytophagales bacterium]|nr:hypothetical protein [Armatimonadota bacterium]
MRSNIGILLRLMAEVPNADEAETIIGSVASQIKAFAKIKKRTVEQYWKIPTYQEITFYLQPFGDADTAYNRLIALVQGAWTHGGDNQDGWSR